MNFPYLPYAVRDKAEHYLYRPVIPVDLAGPHGEVDFYALVDTGSDDTLIPKCVADELGLVTNEERVEEVTGIGGERIAVVQADVELRVSDGHETVFWNAAVGVVAGRDGGATTSSWGTAPVWSISPHRFPEIASCWLSPPT